MKESFNIHRFVALFARYWAEYKTALLLISLISVPAVFYHEIVGGVIRLGSGSFSGFLSILIMVYLFFAFRSVDKQERLGYFLLLPASAIEKFLFLMLAGTLLPYLFLVGEIYVAKGIVFLFQIDVAEAANDSVKTKNFDSLPAFLWSGFTMSVIIAIFFSFRKLGLMRSMVWFFVIYSIGLKFLDQYIVSKWFGERINSNPMGEMKSNFSFSRGKELIDGGLYADFWPVSLVLLGCFWLAMLYMMLLKLREMEKGL